MYVDAKFADSAGLNMVMLMHLPSWHGSTVLSVWSVWQHGSVTEQQNHSLLRPNCKILQSLACRDARIRSYTGIVHA